MRSAWYLVLATRSSYEFAAAAELATPRHRIRHRNTVFPWFWMFPARGQGVMGLREGDLRVPAFALCSHIAYGLALGLGLELAGSRLAERGRALLE